MSIFGVQSSSQTASPQSLAALLQQITQQVTQSDGGTATTSSSGVSGAASTDFSKPAELFSQLQSLASSDPAKFKQVTADFANKLTALAQQTGGSQGQFLTDLAAKFQTASQTGDASGLAPKGGGHHHHHSGGGSGSASSSSAGSAAAAYSQNSAPSLADLLASSTSSSSSGSSSSGASTGTSPQDALKSLFDSLSQELSN